MKFILFLLGFCAVVVYVNYPDVIENLKSCWEYVRISGQYNHFFYNQKVLAQWLPHFDLKDTRGGWVWIIKYFMLMMPLLFPLYIAGVVYVLRRAFSPGTVLWVVLSFLPPVLAEIKGVAQYGANYFPAMFGFIMLMGYAASVFIRDPLWPRLRMWALIAAVVYGLGNGYVFANDIYPSRMATTFISRFIERQGSKDVYTFRTHPLRRNIVDHLNPRALKEITFIPIDSVAQASSGHILLPPPGTDSIYRGSNGDYNDFDDDLVLNQIIRQGKLADYAIASFKTLGSSLIWGQEEEILAYRYLMLNQFPRRDLTRAWILDAQKIQKDRGLFLPTEEDLFLYRNHVRNIGTQTRQVMYTGYQGAVGKATRLKGIAARVFKMGDPQDHLRAFVFRVDDRQPMWLPYAPNFISQPLSASAISNSPAGEGAIFTFDPPLELRKGAFSVVIYRDGKESDRDFYRVYADVLGRMEE
ncbi:MAG: hypothetical protein HY591_03015 [Candidatus Omnitrophica bacterium]|nr:hypothetical protein [Candidatus Omnitrophota bacterium]